MKISVLTACYNAAETIHHTIESFLSQTHGDREMIIQDGGSTDATLEIARSYPQEQISVFSESDSGMYDALNKGLQRFSGDAVGVLNADDRYHDSDALALVAAGLEAHCAVHGHLDFVASHETGTIRRKWRAEPRPPAGFRTGWMPAHPTFYVRRAVVETVGPFDLSLRIASDYDWMMRAVELHKFETAVIDHVLIDMATGGQSTSGFSSSMRHNLEALRARRKWLGSGVIDYAFFAKPARKIGQFIPSLPGIRAA